MRAQHKIVSSMLDKAEYQMVEGRIIGTVFRLNYAVFRVFVKKYILRSGISTAIR